MIKILITIHISKFITFDFIYLFIYLFQIKQIKTKLILKSKNKTSYKLRTNITGVEVQISQVLRLYVDASEIKRKN